MWKEPQVNLFRRTTDDVVDNLQTRLTEAQSTVVTLAAALRRLRDAVDDVKPVAEVPAGTLARHPLGEDLAVRAPHLQDPRLAAAMRHTGRVLDLLDE